MPDMPGVNQTFEYRGDTILVPPARPGAAYPYESAGGKATVVRVERNKTLWALKIFYHKYRSERQLISARRLAAVKDVPGLHAATQEVIEPSDSVTQQWPDFRWSVLMPWVSGLTWGELLGQVCQGKHSYTRPDAEVVALGILQTLQPLEQQGIVHCDLSSGNVMLASNRRDGVQLVDLEEMVIRASDAGPCSYTSGSAGYNLPGVTRTDCPEGDRYAATILIAEALALASPHAKVLASTEGMFGGNRNNQKAQARFDSVYQDLTQWQPRFADHLRNAWNAQSLRDCAAVSDLLHSIGAGAAPPHAVTDRSRFFGDRATGIPSAAMPAQNPPPAPPPTSPVAPPAHAAAFTGRPGAISSDPAHGSPAGPGPAEPFIIQKALVLLMAAFILNLFLIKYGGAVSAVVCDLVIAVFGLKPLIGYVSSRSTPTQSQKGKNL